MEKYPFLFSRKDESQEVETKIAESMAQWALLQFINGEVQSIKRTFYIKDCLTEIRLSDLIDGQTTIVRIRGTDIGESEKFDWLAIAKIGGNNYFYKIDTPGNMGSLEPRVDDYSLSEIQVFSHEDIIEFLDIPQFKELLQIDQDPKNVDIVYSGSYQSARQAVYKRVQEPAFALTPSFQRD
jgi:hypothetical protein